MATTKTTLNGYTNAATDLKSSALQNSQDSVWKQLGYSSYQDYLNAINKNANNVIMKYSSNAAVTTSGNNKLTDSNDGAISNNTSLEDMPTTVSASNNKTYTSNSATDTSQNNNAEQTTASANAFGSTYNYETAFLDWYKNNYGTDYDGSNFIRGSGMSDVDWEIGNSLYDYYKAAKNYEEQYNADVENTNSNYDYNNESAASNRDYTVNEANDLYASEIAKLEENYGKAADALNTSKRNSQQNASITLDKLKKYLPMQVKAQGLGGLGVSESTLLQAYNNYNNTMGDIASDYNTNKTSLETSYNESKSGYDSTHDSAVNSANNLYDSTVAENENNRTNALADLLSNYKQQLQNNDTSAKTDATSIFDKYKTAYENEQTNNFTNASEIIQNSTSESADDIMAQFSNLNLTDAQRQQLQAQANTVAQSNIKAEKTYDKDTAYSIVQATIDSYIEAGKYDAAKEYLEQNKASMGDDVYNANLNSINYAQQEANADEEAEDAETAQDKLDEKITSGKVYITYNDKSYKLTDKLDNTSNEIVNNNSFTKALKELGYSGPYDDNIENGTTLTIQCDAYGKDVLDWADFVGWLIGPNHYLIDSAIYTRTVTYYNGEWYRSEEK